MSSRAGGRTADTDRDRDRDLQAQSGFQSNLAEVDSPLIDLLLNRCGHRPVREFASAIRVSIQGAVGPKGGIDPNSGTIQDFSGNFEVIRAGLVPTPQWVPSWFVWGSAPPPRVESLAGSVPQLETGSAELSESRFYSAISQTYWRSVDPNSERTLIFFRQLDRMTPLNDALWWGPQLQNSVAKRSVLAPDRDLRVIDFFQIFRGNQKSGSAESDSGDPGIRGARTLSQKNSEGQEKELRLRWELDPTEVKLQPCMKTQAPPPSACDAGQFPEDFSALDGEALIRQHEADIEAGISEDSSEAKDKDSDGSGDASSASDGQGGYDPKAEKAEIRAAQKTAREEGEEGDPIRERQDREEDYGLANSVVRKGLRRANDVGFAYAVEYRTPEGRTVGDRGKTRYTKNAYFIYRLMTRPPCAGWTISYAAFNYHNGALGYAKYYEVEPDSSSGIRVQRVQRETQQVPTSAVEFYGRSISQLFNARSRLELNSCWSAGPGKKDSEERPIGEVFGRNQPEMDITAYLGVSRPLGYTADPPNASDSRIMNRILRDGKTAEGKSIRNQVHWDKKTRSFR